MSIVAYVSATLTGKNRDLCTYESKLSKFNMYWIYFDKFTYVPHNYVIKYIDINNSYNINIANKS